MINQSHMPSRPWSQGAKMKVEHTWQRAPENTILPILHAHAGQSIMISVSRLGHKRIHDKIKEGEAKGTPYELGRRRTADNVWRREPYDIPTTKNAINNAYKGRNYEGWRYDWVTGSDEPGKFHLEVGDVIQVYVAHAIAPNQVRARRPVQRYRSGTTHCVFGPMIDYFQKSLDEVNEKAQLNGYKTKKSEQNTRSKHKMSLDAVLKLQDTYAEGVPDDLET